MGEGLPTVSGMTQRQEHHRRPSSAWLTASESLQLTAGHLDCSAGQHVGECL